MLHILVFEADVVHFNFTAQSNVSDAMPNFSEDDRSLFLEICGIRPLSESVTIKPQTENLRPSPVVQDMVGLLVPYIQRFLWHHEELCHRYRELLENNIREKIKQLSFVQVRICGTVFKSLFRSVTAKSQINCSLILTYPLADLSFFLYIPSSFTKNLTKHTVVKQKGSWLVQYAVLLTSLVHTCTVHT